MKNRRDEADVPEEGSPDDQADGFATSAGEGQAVTTADFRRATDEEEDGA